MAKGLENYVEVKDRVALFWEEFPTGSIKTFITYKEAAEIIFEARVFRTREDVLQDIYTSGFAREIEGANNINRTSHVEVGETSAIGRALANMGFSTRADEPRPSREEMEKSQRIDDQFEADLDLINKYMLDEEDHEVTIKGKVVWLKEFIKKNKARVTSQPSAASEIATLILSVTEDVDSDEEDDDNPPTV